MVQNISQIIGVGREGEENPSPISSLDVELVADIFNQTLSTARPTVEDRDDYMMAFDSMQSVSTVQLRAANQKTQSVQG